MKAIELRKKSKEELKQELHDLLSEQFKLRMQKVPTGSFRASDFQKVRKNIARVKTILREQEIMS